MSHMLRKSLLGRSPVNRAWLAPQHLLVISLQFSEASAEYVNTIRAGCNLPIYHDLRLDLFSALPATLHHVYESEMCKIASEYSPFDVKIARPFRDQKSPVKQKRNPTKRLENVRFELHSDKLLRLHAQISSSLVTVVSTERERLLYPKPLCVNGAIRPSLLYQRIPLAIDADKILSELEKKYQDGAGSIEAVGLVLCTSRNSIKFGFPASEPIVFPFKPRSQIANFQDVI